MFNLHEIYYAWWLGFFEKQVDQQSAMLLYGSPNVPNVRG